MNETSHTVLSLLSSAVFGKPLSEFEPSLNWEEIYKECRIQSVATLFDDILDKLPVSEELKLKWTYTCIRGKQHSKAILKVQNEIHNLFLSEKISYAVLKGFAAGQYYPRPECRTMGDLDIIVSSGDFEKAQRVLENHDFKLTLNPDCYSLRHVPYEKNGIEIELHRYFAETKNRNSRDILLNNMIEKALARTEIRQIYLPEDDETYCFSALPELENGLVLLKHMVQHIPTGLGYRQLIDFLVYANTYLDDSVWSSGNFCRIIRELHLEKMAKVCVRMGQIYFGMGKEITWCKDVDDSACKELMDYLTESGNFGRKNEKGDERITRVLRMSQGSVFSILKHEQEAGLKYCKIVQKCFVLRPFAWIFGCIRHLKMLLKEKKIKEVFEKLPSRKDSVSIVKTLDLDL